MTTAVICTALLATLIFGLGMNVSRVRSRSTNQLPTQLDDPLFVAIRAHGNATEYIPAVAILMLLVGSQEPGSWAVALFIAVTAARFLHAFGVLAAGDMSQKSVGRHVGAIATDVGGLALAIATVVMFTT
jgi:uncharacterized membrane protein YecN with MAPEG domain